MTNLHHILVSNIINLQKTFNTRTIGGLRNKEGLTVKKNILFRSDGLNNLNDNDIIILKKFNIKRIVDFRSNKEINRNPDVIWDENINYIHMPINSDKRINEEIHQIINNEKDKNIEDYLIDENKNFILNYTNLYSKFIKDFINCGGQNTIFHCTAGKDRTGLATALILSILGVSREDIINEYMFSNFCIEKTLSDQIVKVCGIFNIDVSNGFKIIPLLKVNLKYINMALKTIDDNYDNIENYIKNGLLISESEIKKLKDILCE